MGGKIQAHTEHSQKENKPRGPEGSFVEPASEPTRSESPSLSLPTPHPLQCLRATYDLVFEPSDTGLYNGMMCHRPSPMWKNGARFYVPREHIAAAEVCYPENQPAWEVTKSKRIPRRWPTPGGNGGRTSIRSDRKSYKLVEGKDQLVKSVHENDGDIPLGSSPHTFYTSR